MQMSRATTSAATSSQEAATAYLDEYVDAIKVAKYNRLRIDAWLKVAEAKEKALAAQVVEQPVSAP